MLALMTGSIDDLIRRAASLPKAAQEELRRVISDMEEQYSGVYRLTEEEEAAIDASLADLEKADFADDDAIQAIYDKARAPRG